MLFTLKKNYSTILLLCILISVYFPFVILSFGERNIRAGDITALLLMPFFFLIFEDFINKCPKHRLALVALSAYMFLHIVHMFYLWGDVPLIIPLALLIKDTLLVCLFVVCVNLFSRLNFISIISKFSIFYTFVALIYVIYQFIFSGFLGFYTYSMPFVEDSSIGSGLLLFTNFTLLLVCYAVNNNFLLLYASIANFLLLLGTASRTSILAAVIFLIPSIFLGIKVLAHSIFKLYSINKIILVISSFMLGLFSVLFITLQDFFYGNYSFIARLSNLDLFARYQKASVNIDRFSTDLGVFFFGNGRGYLEATGQSFYLDSQFARSYLESGFFMAIVIYSLFFYFLGNLPASTSAKNALHVASVNHPNFLNALLVGFIFAIFAQSYSYDVFHLSLLSFPLVLTFAFMYSCRLFIQR